MDVSGNENARMRGVVSGFPAQGLAFIWRLDFADRLAASGHRLRGSRGL